MNVSNDTPDSHDDSDVKGVDAEDLANLDVDAAQLDEDGEDFAEELEDDIDTEIDTDIDTDTDTEIDADTDTDLVDG